MKAIIIKTLAVLCFVGSFVIFGIAVERSSFLCVAAGLAVFALLIPISRSEVFNHPEAQ